MFYTGWRPFSDEDLKRFGDTATRLGYPWACTRMTSTSIPMPRCGTRLPSHSHQKGRQLDKYRAQQIAYGYASFIGREQIGHVDFMAFFAPLPLKPKRHGSTDASHADACSGRKTWWVLTARQCR